VSILGPALNRGGRNNGEIVLDVHEKVDVDKLLGEEGVVGIAKYGFELVGSSGRVNMIVDGLEFSAGDFRGVVAVVGVDNELTAGTEVGVHIGKLILRQAENYRYRLELRYDKKSIRVRSMHDISRIDETQPDTATDWRCNARICKLQLGVVNLALVRRNGPGKLAN